MFGPFGGSVCLIDDSNDDVVAVAAAVVV